MKQSLCKFALCAILLGIFAVSPLQVSAQSKQSQNFRKGTLIIPMDTTYQDVGVLEAYGLLYRLLRANIPVHWVIKKGKKLGDADLSVVSRDLKSNKLLKRHGYRGGPFVIELAFVSKALPLIQSWQKNSTVTVHRAQADFQARTGRLLTAAPTIAVIADGNEKIAFKYLNTAKIPDSTGKSWPAKNDKNGAYPNHPDVMNVKRVAGPTRTNHKDGSLFRKSGVPAYCQMMTMHWDVKKADDEVVAEYRSFLTYPTHVFAHCQAVNAVENNVKGRFLTPKGFVIDNKFSGVLSFLNLDTPFAQMDGPFEVVGGSERGYSLPKGDKFLTRNTTMITDKVGGPGTRDIWMSGYLDGKCTTDEDDVGCTAGVGKVSYLGGHQYDIDLPISKNPKTQGTRLFLNSLFEASCATEEGQPKLSLIKQGPAQTSTPTVTYTLYANNLGPGPALDVKLKDTLPANTTFVSATRGGKLVGRNVEWAVGDLAKAQQISVKLTVRFNQVGTYTNKFVTTYRVGVNTKQATSNSITTVYQKSLPPTEGGFTPDGGTQPDAGGPDGPSLPDSPTSQTCEQPNMLVLLDRSGSMQFLTHPLCPKQDCSVSTQKSCQKDTDCSPMARQSQPAPGTTPLYSAKCIAQKCHYSRWDIAQNTVKELSYQYGGSAPNYTNSKLRLGLITFNNTASLDAPVVSNPPAIEKALKAQVAGGGTNYTSAFLRAYQHFKALIAKDSVVGRPMRVLLITDGKPNEGCQSSVNIVRDMFQGTGAYRLQSKQGVSYRIQTYVIGFGSSLDSVARGCLNQLAVAGGTQRCNPGIPGCLAYYFADNETLLKKTLDSILSTTSPEVCDSKDNDCDGQVDEGLTRSCYTGPAGTQGKGLCRSGQSTCRAGRWGSCQKQTLPSQEKCDNADNDCDGKIDEDFSSVGSPCSVGKGVCKRSGQIACKADGSGTACFATPGTPGKEICGNGLDDNCDGKVDENCSSSCTNGKEQSCYSGPQGTRNKGACRAGSQTCKNGQWSVCQGQVVPGTEVCDGKDNDCNGQTDENLKRACRTICGSGTEQCQGGRWTACTAPSPKPEVCGNQRDDNCNGQVDEGCNNPCKNGDSRPCYSGPPNTAGQGICKQGTMTCSSGRWGPCVGEVRPQPELCDGKDNDCDGSIDDQLSRVCRSKCGAGTETCRLGKWESCSAPVPSQEVCDGQDNNCDGTVDEGCTCKAGDARACYTGPPNTRQTGICEDGLQVCISGKWGPCNNEVKPSKEICDNRKDDNCDGKVDEGCQACKEGSTRPCPSPCGPGKQSCKAGKWGACQGVTQAAVEVCDGKDNDCDGQIDEGMVRACKTKCGPGIDRCVRGQRTGCLGPKPSPEVCDGIDNDCDGNVDNQAKCPGSSACIEGICPRPCRNQECPQGQLCIKGACLPKLSCAKVTCSNGQFCQGGRCIKTCDVVQCASGFVCWKGVCSPHGCDTFGCPSGRACKGGICVPNPCAKLQCQSGEFCKDGKCLRLCSKQQCTAGTLCKAGRCLPDLCSKQKCKQGDICYQGLCVPDPCVKIQCPQGKVCNLGECVDDPCKTIKCPSGLACKDGDCVDLCKGVQCSAGKACSQGQCVPDDCYNRGCSSGKICQQGKCIDDPCVNVQCGSKAFCRGGQCIPSCHLQKCQSSERCIDGSCGPKPCEKVNCPSDQICYEGTCVADQCKGKTCGTKRVCNPSTGRCEDDPCLSVRCPAGSVCRSGQCQDPCASLSCPKDYLCERGVCLQKNCYSRGCPSGQICKNSQCKADPCQGVSCGSNEFCREGQCIKSCANVKCNKSERCEDGQCVPNPCANVTCQAGTFCLKGKCEPDLCVDVYCGLGLECDPLTGKCVDNPCNHIRCPSDQSCYRGQCVGKTFPSPAPEKLEEQVQKPQSKDGGSAQESPPTEQTTSPAGCACDASPHPVSFFLFVLFWLTLRSRRKPTHS